LIVVVVVTFVEVEDEASLDELVEAFTELELDEPEPHVPPTGLQPVPQ
jgi:hypothetical protein